MSQKLLKLFLAVLLLFASIVSTTPVKAQKPLEQMSFEDILKSYYFVADFDKKIPERDISDILFWRYPYKMGHVDFPIQTEYEEMHKEIPVTMGQGHIFHYLNSGRVAFFDGKYELAKKFWLKGRTTFKNEYPYHRRMDYFLSQAYMQLALEEAKGSPKGLHAENARAQMNNSSTFLAWALFKKEDVPDDLFEEIAPKQIYNLASIYYYYRRFSASYGAARRGLDWLRKRGKTEYQSKLLRILAESFIQNRSYAETIQQYDLALRMKPSKEDAAGIFARVGDIYFDLNNYEIAAMNYAIADKLYRSIDKVDPQALLLLAESRFWQGRFAEANSMFRYALGFLHSDRAIRKIPESTVAYAKLRLADSYLALKEMKRAKASYYDIARDFRNHPAGIAAKVRGACLDLPQFDGNNVSHARSTLASIKGSDIPPQARELAWACEVGSYAKRERSLAMIDRVRGFHQQYPRSRFLKSLVEPVEEVRQKALYDFLDQNKHHEAIAYYKAYKDLLFKDISRSTRLKLFRIAIDMNERKTADELFKTFNNQDRMNDRDSLRLAAYRAETKLNKKNTKRVKSFNSKVASKLNKRKWTIKRSTFAKNYIHRILSTPYSEIHMNWIYRMISTWDDGKDSTICTERFPLTMRLYSASSSGSKARKTITKETLALVDKLLPQMLKTDESCSVSLLNFEISILRDKPKTLANKYLKRRMWPMGEELATIFWEVAEIAHSAGHRKEARELWKTIVDKAPSDSPKVAFSQNRLERRKTEFEQLWQ